MPPVTSSRRKRWRSMRRSRTRTTTCRTTAAWVSLGRPTRTCISSARGSSSTSSARGEHFSTSSQQRSRPVARRVSDSTRVIVARALRGWADGLVSVLLAGYLTRLGFGPVEVGAIVTGTLVGSAAVTTAVGLAGGDVARRTVLLGAAVLMTGTGVGFAALRAFWPLFAVAVVGTLNPSGGDVSVFLPVEQAVLAETTR